MKDSRTIRTMIRRGCLFTEDKHTTLSSGCTNFQFMVYIMLRVELCDLSCVIKCAELDTGIFISDVLYITSVVGQDNNNVKICFLEGCDPITFAPELIWRIQSFQHIRQV